MIFWLLAIVIAVATSAILLYAAVGRASGVSADAVTATEAHYRQQLSEIEADVAAGEMAATDGIAAKAELARELLRQRREAGPALVMPAAEAKLLVPGAIVAMLLVAFVTYSFLGNPNLPAEPFATRPDAQLRNMSVDDMIKKAEANLAADPSDLRGWRALAPIYMQEGNYAKAEHAFRQILALAPPTSADETNLAEALMMQNSGQMTDEVLGLAHKAVDLDAKDPRPRLLLAAAAMRDKDYVRAVGLWNDAIALGADSDPWMAVAKAGLAAAEAGRDGKPIPGAPAAPTAADAANPAQSQAIVSMVNGLADKLAKQGGTIEEWTQLVRSEIVLGDLGKAQSAYDAAKKAYPDAATRAELDGLAAQAGLKLDGSTP